MSTTASPAPNRPKPPTVTPDRMVESPWHKAIPYLVFALIVSAVLILMTLIFGQVSGEEFCPDTFEQRRFHYYQIPILRIQVTGMTRRNSGIWIAETVEEHAANVDSAATVKNWDLVTSKRVGTDVWQGDAKILCDLLTIKDYKNGYLWQSWSEKYPHLADRFWPVVADTAQAGSYILMPDLFDLAAQAGFDSTTGVEDEDEEDDDDSDVEDGDEDESNSEDDKEIEEPSDDIEEPNNDSNASDDDGENDAQEKPAGNDDGDDGESSESDVSDESNVKKKAAKKKKKKKPLTPEQQAEAAAFESSLRDFMAKETIVLANQFETADELTLARRAYELATKYSDDPTALENFDRLNELVPKEEAVDETPAEPAEEKPVEESSSAKS